MTRVVVVANEPPWPVVNGGRSRVAGIVSALSQEHELTVLAGTQPSGGGDSVATVRHLPPSRTSRLRSLLGTSPRLGARVLDARAAGAVAAEVARLRPAAVLVTHSYLAPMLDLDVPVLLDLPNLEVDRPQPHRLVSQWEAAKARRWEPRVARDAALCLAVDDADAAVLHRWGARDVVVVPNSSDASPCPPSPPDGSVLAVADWTYAPNRAGLADFLRGCWPRLRRRVPAARLVLVGRGAPDRLPDGATAVGFADDLTPHFAAAALVVAPARSGAGTQLKVVEGVARGRVVAATEFGARSLPRGAAAFCPTGLDHDELAQLLLDVPERHRREAGLRGLTTDWTSAVRPLSERLHALAETAHG